MRLARLPLLTTPPGAGDGDIIGGGSPRANPDALLVLKTPGRGMVLFTGLSSGFSDISLTHATSAYASSTRAPLLTAAHFVVTFG
jgi:hypothetical protein